MMAATPAPSNFFASSTTPRLDASAQPSTATLPPRASMPTAILPGNFWQASFTRSGIAHRDGAEDHARQPPVQPGLDMRQRADAAAELHRVLRRLEDRLDRRAVDALAREGAVEVDDVQPFETLILEGLRLRRRIGVVDGRASPCRRASGARIRRPSGRWRERGSRAQAPSTMAKCAVEYSRLSFSAAWYSGELKQASAVS